MLQPPANRRELQPATLALGILAGIIVVKLGLHLVANVFGGYEFHRDEFLYLAMGEHLRLFGMDFPPAIGLAARIVKVTLGDGLLAIRTVPALLSTAVIVIALLTARDLGGGWFAQLLVGLAILSSPLFLRSGNLFQPVVFDQLAWTAALFALIQVIRRDDQRWWLMFGAMCGIGLLAKFSMLVFGVGAFVAILMTPMRRALATRWPWLAAFIALAVGSPTFIGQVRLGWPLLAQMGDLQRAQLSRVAPLDFITGQMGFGPVFFLAAAGAVALLVTPRFRPYRVVGWTCVVAWLVLLIMKGKPYYAGPLLPVLAAVAAVELERVARPRIGPLLRWSAVGAVIVYGAVTLPLGVPIVPPEALERYLEWLGDEDSVTTNVGARERLPQDYADMLGWEGLVAEVARVYHELPPDDRRRAVILASNYGEAGAIDYYGPRRGLPQAVAFVGSYWFFGPGERPGAVTLAIGFAPDDLRPWFGSVEQVASYSNPYGVEEQRDNRILLARDPGRTLQEVWPSLAGIN